MLASDKPRTTVGNGRLVREDNGTIIFPFGCRMFASLGNKILSIADLLLIEKNIIITFSILSKKAMIDKDTFLDLFINLLEKNERNDLSLSSLQNQSIF